MIKYSLERTFVNSIIRVFFVSSSYSYSHMYPVAKIDVECSYYKFATVSATFTNDKSYVVIKFNVNALYYSKAYFAS